MAFAELQFQPTYHSGTFLGTNVPPMCRHTNLKLARYIGQHVLYNTRVRTFQWTCRSRLYSIIALNH